MSQEIESNRPGAGSVIALIVVPSLLSGAGLAFLLVAFLNHLIGFFINFFISMLVKSLGRAIYPLVNEVLGKITR